MNDDEVFAEALALPAAERAAFLERACTADAGRRRHLEALLSQHDAAARFFAAPPVVRPGPAHGEGPGDVIGRYRLGERLGEGGCGVVWRAEQTAPVRREVALKVIKPGMDTCEVIARFEGERQALALMDHPHIARVFDAGTTDLGRPYFVMELVCGVPLTRYCDERRLRLGERLELFLAVCRAVHHAHQKGIIHRDLKPSNILVTEREGVAVPKVIDFGIAKATQEPLTAGAFVTGVQQFLGTPAYMSPEQAGQGGVDLDTRADIYALGVMLYELLTGVLPFDTRALLAAGVEEFRRVVREVEPVRPSARLAALGEAERASLAARCGMSAAALAGACRGDLDWIVLRCLEKERARRYESAHALELDLRRHLACEPVTARPPSRGYVLRKLVRRHRLAVGSAAAVGAAVVLGAAVSAWQAVRATRAEHEQARLRLAAETARTAEARLRAAAEAQELAARRRAYAADINRVQQALEADNLGQAQELLQRQRPQPGQIDLRGWEWRYLWQLCRGDQVAEITPAGDNSTVSVAISPDGEWVAWGAGSYGSLGVRNRRTGDEFRLPAGRSSVRVALAPHAPVLAAWVFTAEAPYSRVQLWDLRKRQQTHELVVNRDGVCSGLGFSADGRSLWVGAIGAETGLSRWDVATGRRTSFLPTPGAVAIDNRFQPLAVNGDFTRAAYAFRGEGAGIRVIELPSGRVVCSAPGAAEFTFALAFSPDGRTLAAGSGWTEGRIRLLDTESGRELGGLEGHRRFVSGLQFLPDGRTLISASGDHTLRLWDLTERRLLRTLRGPHAELFSLALTPDAREGVSGGKDGAVLGWNFQSRPREIGPVRLPGGPHDWQFANGGSTIIAVEPRGRFAARVVERTGSGFAVTRSLLELEGGEWTHARLAEHRPLVAAWAINRPVRVWDWRTGAVVREFPAGEGWSMPGVVAFRRQAATILLARSFPDRLAVLEEWDLVTGAKRREWPLGSTQPAAALAPDESWVVFAASPGRFTRHASFPDLPSAYVRLGLGDSRRVVLPGNTRESDAAGGFSPDGRWYAIGSGLGFVDLIDTGTWRRAATLAGAKSGMYSPVFSADGARLAIAGSGDDSLMIWDTATRERLLALPSTGSVLGQTALSPDGRWIGARTAGGPSSHAGAERGALYLWRAPTWDEIAAAERQ